MNIIKSTMILGLVVSGIAVAGPGGGYLDKGKLGKGYYSHGEGSVQMMGDNKFVEKRFVASLNKDQLHYLIQLKGIKAAKDTGDFDGGLLDDHQELVKGNFIKSLSSKQKLMLKKLGVDSDSMDNLGTTSDGDATGGDKTDGVKDQVAQKKDKPSSYLKDLLTTGGTDT